MSADILARFYGLIFFSAIFIIGAVAIGLVLLDHSHCSGDKEVEDPHAGHNH